jgi:hypothetical protein
VIDLNHSRGVMAMLVSRFEGEQLGRLLDLKRAVDSGERLGEQQSSLLERACGEAMQSKRLVDRHPEYHALYARSVRLYKEITARALENELNARPAAAIPGASGRLN